MLIPSQGVVVSGRTEASTLFSEYWSYFEYPVKLNKVLNCTANASSDVTGARGEGAFVPYKTEVNAIIGIYNIADAGSLVSANVIIIGVA